MNNDNNSSDTGDNNSYIEDKELFNKLSEPVTKEQAEANSAAFYKELCELRIKHHIPEMVVAYSINTHTEHVDGNLPVIKPKLYIGYRGGKITDRLILELLTKTPVGGALQHLLRALENTLNPIKE